MLIFWSDLSNPVHISYKFISMCRNWPKIFVNKKVSSQVNILCQIACNVLMVTSYHLHINHGAPNSSNSFFSRCTRRVLNWENTSKFHPNPRTSILIVNCNGEGLISTLTEVFICSLCNSSNIFVVLYRPFHITSIILGIITENFCQEALRNLQLLRKALKLAVAIERHSAKGTLNVSIKPVINISIGSIAIIIVIELVFFCLPYFLKSPKYRAFYFVLFSIFLGGT
mmetsp:Transcript_18040/g.27054  ORF Transcript_18040/g.27054 Transcript_18040/m.27054 type:complete len:227 (-) Transcript_18040:742-1422(-)